MNDEMITTHVTMLASGRFLGFGMGWPGAICRGLNVVYSSPSDAKSFRVCFRNRIVHAEFIRSFLSFCLFAFGGGVWFSDGLTCDEQQPANGYCYVKLVTRPG